MKIKINIKSLLLFLILFTLILPVRNIVGFDLPLSFYIILLLSLIQDLFTDIKLGIA